MAGEAVHNVYYDAVTVGSGSDTLIYSPPLLALQIGTAGTGALKVITAAGTTLILTGMAVGLLPLSVKQVFATGTTVSGITGLR